MDIIQLFLTIYAVPTWHVFKLPVRILIKCPNHRCTHLLQMCSPNSFIIRCPRCLTVTSFFLLSFNSWVFFHCLFSFSLRTSFILLSSFWATFRILKHSSSSSFHFGRIQKSPFQRTKTFLQTLLTDSSNSLNSWIRWIRLLWVIVSFTRIKFLSLYQMKPSLCCHKEVNRYPDNRFSWL